MKALGLLLVIALAFAGGWRLGRGGVPTTPEIAATERSIDLLDLELALLRPRYQASAAELDTVVDTLWRRARAQVDSFVDSLVVPMPFVIGLAQAGDKVVAACRRLEADCNELVATEKARGDSLQVNAGQWKARARGPLLAFTGGLSVDPRHPTGGLYGSVEIEALHGSFFGRAEQRLLSDSSHFAVRVGARKRLRLF